METRPVDRIEDSQSGETPIDVAIPHSQVNPQGDRYRDFSADRREYRAQMRHRAAEQLRLVELKAQLEAEAAAAHAEADAATLRPDASSSSQGTAPHAIQEQQAVEHQRRSSSSREPGRQAVRDAAERLEAARRAEAAALVDSIARREEREIAEAQAAALRREAHYTESEPPSRQLTPPQSNRAIPERVSDSYSPPLLAEGEYFETPGTPIAELAADRSRWFALKEIFLDVENGGLQDTQSATDMNRKTPIIAVFSMAGGAGKTTLVATLGRTLSSLGEKVLLADVTSHGLLPFYFGASELIPGAVRTFLPPSGCTDAPIRLVNYDTHSHNEKSRDEIVEDLRANSQSAHRVLIDMDVNCRWLVECVAPLQPTVLVPLSADMNSIISLQSVERSFASMQDAEGEPLRPLYVLNQFDPSLPLHLDVREVLRQQLGDRLLPFVIRRAAGVSEALAEGMTIVDYNPESIAVQDYLDLANWVRAKSAPASVGFRKLRWSERRTSSC